MTMSDQFPRGGYLTTRQAAHALGITVAQLNYMRVNGEANPSYRLPGKGSGELLWTATEIRRILALDKTRRTFRRRRKVLTRQPMDGLIPIVPKVRRKRTFSPPPDRETA